MIYINPKLFLEQFITVTLKLPQNDHNYSFQATTHFYVCYIKIPSYDDGTVNSH